MRVGGKSAEAIVVRRPGESLAERRAEGRGVELDWEFRDFAKRSEAAGGRPMRSRSSAGKGGEEG